jgi:hypothetical protein
VRANRWFVAGAAVAVAGLVAAPGATATVTSAGGVKYVSKRIQVDGKSRATGVADCPRSTHVLGGGELNGGGYGSIKLSQSFPEDSGDGGTKPDDGWEVRVRNGKSHQVPVKVQAICGDTRVQYAKHRFDVPAMTETDERDQSCPANTFAYSGGVGAGPNSRIYLNSTFPVNPSSTGATAWGAYVDNPSGQTKATVYAVCGKSKPKVVTQVLSGLPLASQSGTTTPPCPAVKHGYGGGLTTTAGYSDLAINSLGPIPVAGAPGREWRALADVIGPFSPSITVYILCGPALS